MNTRNRPKGTMFCKQTYAAVNIIMLKTLTRAVSVNSLAFS